MVQHMMPSDRIVGAAKLRKNPLIFIIIAERCACVCVREIRLMENVVYFCELRAFCMNL